MDNNLLQLYSGGTEAKGNNLKLDRTGLFPQRGIIDEMADRCITKMVAEKYSTEKLFQPDGVAYAYSFPSFVDGKMIAQKIKRFDKKMKWLYEGDKMPELPLYGQHLFPSGGKYLTITEGEEDAQAAYQMLKDAAPNFEPAVVSLFNGASSAEKECKRNWEYINSFENIIICFDGDDEGQKAAQKVARLFDYRPRIVSFGEARKTAEKKWEWKDANDYLKGSRQRDFVGMWWRAERLTPKGILSFKSLWDAMTKKDTDIGVPWPWDGIQKKLHDIRTGQFIVIKAPPKVGKTSLLKEVAYHIHQTSPYNVGLIFLEDTKKTIGMGMCALHMNKPIQFPDVPYTLEELQEAHIAMAKDERLIIFDPEDERTAENILNKIMYFVKAHDCKFIILDHISMLAYQAEDDNERKYLDKLCADLKALTTKLDICIMAVIHVNDDGKTRGSRAPVQLCNALINLVRDKLAKDPVVANTTEVIVEENRLTGDSGTACYLFYNRDTGRLTEVDPALRVERSVQFDE